MDYSNPNEVFARELAAETPDEFVARFERDFKKAEDDFDKEFARTSRFIDRGFKAIIIGTIVVGTLSVIASVAVAYVILHFVLKAW